MEILNAILLIWAWIIIIFQVFFINYLWKKNEEYLNFSKEVLKNLKENKKIYTTLIEAYKLKLEVYEKNK